MCVCVLMNNLVEIVFQILVLKLYRDLMNPSILYCDGFQSISEAIAEINFC